MSATASCARCEGPLYPWDRICGRCGLSASPSSSGEPAADSPWSQVLQQLRAATAGEFVIQRELGRGGFAAVFLAHEIALGRNVAIKVMSPAVMMGEGMVDRFLQEARTVASLDHPHIITIHSVRRLEELPYFVMKFVRGRSLEHPLRREGPLPIPVVRAILFQVGSALAYAHRRGVIHRDVKPANILLDSEGNAIVTDFGIAKVAESPSQTVTGMVIGTPTYMSPEQCDAQAVSWASDQYSLGIVAYEMLTGTVPFTGSSLAVMHAHAQTPPPPIRATRPDCPPDLESAVNRMLAKDPAERWLTMGYALAALGAAAVPDTDPLREELARLARLDLSDDDDGESSLVQATIGAFSLAVSPPPELLPVGRKVRLTAVLRDASSRELHRKIEWRSTDPAVATVSADGVVTALGQGETAISASAEGAEGSVRLLVGAPPQRGPASIGGAGVQHHKRWWWAGAAAVAAAVVTVCRGCDARQQRRLFTHGLEPGGCGRRALNHAQRRIGWRLRDAHCDGEERPRTADLGQRRDLDDKQSGDRKRRLRWHDRRQVSRHGGGNSYARSGRRDGDHYRDRDG